MVFRYEPWTDHVISRHHTITFISRSLFTLNRKNKTIRWMPQSVKKIELAECTDTSNPILSILSKIFYLIKPSSSFHKLLPMFLNCLKCISILTSLSSSYHLQFNLKYRTSSREKDGSQSGPRLMCWIRSKQMIAL